VQSANKCLNKQVKTGSTHPATLSNSAKYSVKDMLSDGNVRLSGPCQTETPRQINMKFCMIGQIGKIAWYAKKSLKSVSWVASKNFLAIPYFTSLFLVSLCTVCRPDCLTDMRARWLIRRDLLKWSAFGSRVNMKWRFGIKSPEHQISQPER
jgi:hypothetical protein